MVANPSTTALIIIAADCVVIGATGALIVQLLIRRHRHGRPGRHRATSRTRTAVLETSPPQLLHRVSPEVTDATLDAFRGPTMPLVVPSDPWAGAEDADAILAVTR